MSIDYQLLGEAKVHQMKCENLIYEEKENVAVYTINNSDKMNSTNISFLFDMQEVM